MNIPLSWLREYVDIDCDLNQFCHHMTMSGTKVENTINVADEITNIVVGKLLSVEKHPNADKLVVTKVDVGQGDPLQIVTGATNVYPGAYVPVALDGAELFNGLKITKGKLRGEESNGMLVSVDELGYDASDFPEAPEDGIYIFPQEMPLGMDAKEAMDIVDQVIEFELTSNRPDCYSVTGVAREAAATLNVPFRLPEVFVEEKAQGQASDYIQVEIQNPDLCPRYIARFVKNVKIGPSPRWMRKRLRNAGLRPINNIVDITNYVMLELGQPLHAFDVDTIDESKIIVRNAKEGEKLVTLDGVERTLDSSMVVIADRNKAVAIGGVMGGENSKVSESATAILFEAANFNGPNNRQTAKKLGLRTDASQKYEKGLDPNLPLIAVNRAVQLVEMLGCGDVVPGMVDNYPNIREPHTVKFNPENINKLLGVFLSKTEMASLLSRLEIMVDKENCIATIPTFRPDLQSEADIAEEVARLYGYDKIQATLEAGTPTVGKKSLSQQIENIVKDILTAQGFNECLNYSFESPKVFQKLLIDENSPLRQTVEILNPLGEDYSIMRTITLNGMLQSLSTNYNRRNEEAYLFEIGNTYMPKSLPLTELPEEKKWITIGLYGKADFYTLKGSIEVLLERLGITESTYTPSGAYAWMHPGRCADIKTAAGGAIGYVGEVHPLVLESYEIGAKACIAVLDFQCLLQLANLTKQYKTLPKYPAIVRDIALIVKEDILAKDIEDVICQRGGKLVESFTLFDVYKGSQIDEGYKSVAYTITFRSPDQTLSDDEVNKYMKKIIHGLEENLQAKLRDK